MPEMVGKADFAVSRTAAVRASALLLAFFSDKS